MTVENRERIVKETVYVAKDGKDFHTPREAKVHEWQLDATTVYGVMSRGRRETTEIYSTMELAEEVIKNYEDKYYIAEIYINEGLLRNMF